MLKRSFCSLAVICLLVALLTICASGKENKFETYRVEIAPVEETSRTFKSNLIMTIQPQTTNFIKGEQIDVDVHVYWEQEAWNANIPGSALVYQDSNGTFLLGSVFGRSNETSAISDLIGIDFVYHLDSQSCIATSSYHIGLKNETCMEYGENSLLYSDAIRYLANYSMKAARKAANTCKADNEKFTKGIDDLVTYFDNKHMSGAVSFKMWGASGLLVSGSREIGASVKGDVSKAETDILQENHTAWAVSPTRCHVHFSGSPEVRYSNSEMRPKNDSTTHSFSIPLPGGFSYNVNWTVDNIMVDTGENDKFTDWTVVDVGGIEELLRNDSNSVAGFSNYMRCAPSSIPSGSSKSVAVYGYGEVGYHYAYTDQTGYLNNTTKYYTVQGSTYLTVRNP